MCTVLLTQVASSAAKGWGDDPMTRSGLPPGSSDDLRRSCFEKDSMFRSFEIELPVYGDVRNQEKDTPSMT